MTGYYTLRCDPNTHLIAGIGLIRGLPQPLDFDGAIVFAAMPGSRANNADVPIFFGLCLSSIQDLSFHSVHTLGILPTSHLAFGLLPAAHRRLWFTSAQLPLQGLTTPLPFRLSLRMMFRCTYFSFPLCAYCFLYRVLWALIDLQRIAQLLRQRLPVLSLRLHLCFLHPAVNLVSSLKATSPKCLDRKTTNTEPSILGSIHHDSIAPSSRVFNRFASACEASRVIWCRPSLCRSIRATDLLCCRSPYILASFCLASA